MTDRDPNRAAGLPDREVRELIGDLDRLLEYLQQATGPVAESAVTAVTVLTQVYGTALARVTALAAGQPRLMTSLTEDEVIGSLLILHGLHPEHAATRAARAVEEIRPYLRSHGGDAEFLGISEGAARVRFSGSCQGCGTSAATLSRAVADAVLSAAPELTAVEPETGNRAPQLIPAESLLRKPASAGHAGGWRP
ncbi:MAG: NifU family protein [Streptosporangiaceae bacterium]|nr:NifU family protein [Streptosporangiaceae bacterium]MBV9856311.1 NifU family protein [Streptosporangiaceae bacterium]